MLLPLTGPSRKGEAVARSPVYLPKVGTAMPINSNYFLFIKNISRTNCLKEQLGFANITLELHKCRIEKRCPVEWRVETVEKVKTL